MMKEAMLYEKLEDKRVHCFLCSHECKIADDKFGFCGVRQNMDGKLYTWVYGDAISSNIDPIEKKPLYHFLPGSTSYSIATVGCNFHCGFCQNWQISQTNKRDGFEGRYKLPPEDVVREAKKAKCKSIAYTYTEPTIFFEYAFDTAKLAKEEGIYNIFVTNGYMTQEALDKIEPYLDAANVDLKSFSEDYYREICKGHLKPVLDSIKYMKRLGIWVEVTTLVIPGENDSDEELTNIAEFIASTGKDVPWHISRFHPTYEFTDHKSTPIETLEKAKNIGEDAGLRYIYLGNVGGRSDTSCPECNERVIRRTFFGVENNLEERKCPECGSSIAGVF